jgi:septal ring factor EnvC (AmiA/AmiB activator)
VKTTPEQRTRLLEEFAGTPVYYICRGILDDIAELETDKQSLASQVANQVISISKLQAQLAEANITIDTHADCIHSQARELAACREALAEAQGYVFAATVTGEQEPANLLHKRIDTILLRAGERR